MKDDIETLRRLADGLGTEERKEAMAVLEWVEKGLDDWKKSFDASEKRKYALAADRDSLRKALDDRHAADKKAWSAIMRATGKERGLPDNKEVIAFYVAEVERLEKENSSMLDDIRELDAVCSVLGCEDSLEPASEHARSALDEIDYLRAKLERAREAMEKAESYLAFLDSCKDQTRRGPVVLAKVRAVLSELSADAPAQPPANYNPVGLGLVREKLGRISSNFSDDPRGDADAALNALDKFCERAPPQISDDARSLLDEAIAALEPFADERNDGRHLWNATATDFARARDTLLKLRAARNG